MFLSTILALSPLFLSQPAAAAAPDLFFSEYVEGSGNNKALEIYNATGAAVDLSAGNYQVRMYFNGSTSIGRTVNLSGNIPNGEAFVLAQSTANQAILAAADQLNGDSWYNGNDAVVLVKNGVIIDSIGQIGMNPGDDWVGNGVSTLNSTLRRLPAVCAGRTDATAAFDPSTEWVAFAQDTVDGLGSHTADCLTVDLPPAVQSTVPAADATGVAIDSTIEINFSEPVTVAEDWFTLLCTQSDARAATVSGGPQSFSLAPQTAFIAGETCTLTIPAATVVDQDGEPQSLLADYSWSFTIADFGVCFDNRETPIHLIQGNGPPSGLAGTSVIVEGVVTGNFPPSFNGLFLQQPDAKQDGDPATSEGIFVFTSNAPLPYSAGDLVRLEANVSAFQGITQLRNVSSHALCATGHTVTPTTVTLPLSAPSDYFAWLGMVITFPQDLTVTENFNLGRFGELVLSSGGRLFQPTQLALPGPDAAAIAADNALRRILLDDGLTVQNPDPIAYPMPELTAENTLRSGDIATNVTGILEFRFSEWRIQPVADAVLTTPSTFSFASANPRPAAPEAVGGFLQVASFNVLNYFTTLGSAVLCGPTGALGCRGARNEFDFQRQRAKIIAALVGLDADIVGLIEIENNASASLADLVQGLNDATAPNTYAYIDTGTIGTDAIKLGLIYKPAAATPVNDFAILDSSVDPLFLDMKNRPVLLQTFQDNISGEVVTVAVNHFKSKGSACTDVGDPDLGDGQGNCNQTRTAAAAALIDWLATDPTKSGSPTFLIVGDINAYAQEDPIRTLEAAGYTNLLDAEFGAEVSSYIFRGQAGTLDHALASPALVPLVSGVAIWAINADEPRVLEYSTRFISERHIDLLYSAGPYRSSDHDPILVGLCLGPAPFTLDVSPRLLWPPNHRMVPILLELDSPDVASFIDIVAITSSEPDNGIGDGNTTNDIVINEDGTILLRAERSGPRKGREYWLDLVVEDSCGYRTPARITITVPANQGRMKGNRAGAADAAFLDNPDALPAYYLPAITR